MSAPPEHGKIEIEGVDRPALIFRVTLDGIRAKRLGQAVWLVPLLAFSLLYVFLLVRIGTRTDLVAQILRIFVLAMQVVFIGGAVWLVRSWRNPGVVALLREGIYSRSGLGPLLVPWETIGKVGMPNLSASPALRSARTPVHATALSCSKPHGRSIGC